MVRRSPNFSWAGAGALAPSRQARTDSRGTQRMGHGWAPFGGKCSGRSVDSVAPGEPEGADGDDTPGGSAYGILLGPRVEGRARAPARVPRKHPGSADEERSAFDQALYGRGQDDCVVSVSRVVDADDPERIRRTGLSQG